MHDAGGFPALLGYFGILLLGTALIVYVADRLVGQGKLSGHYQRVQQLSLMKELIAGEWVLSPDRLFYETLRLKGSYQGRAIEFSYQLNLSRDWDENYPHAIFSTHLSSLPDSKPLSFSKRLSLGHGCVKASVQAPGFRGLIGKKSFWNRFFTEPCLWRALESFLIVAQLVEQGQFNAAKATWDRTITGI